MRRSIPQNNVIRASLKAGNISWRPALRYCRCDIVRMMILSNFYKKVGNKKYSKNNSSQYLIGYSDKLCFHPPFGGRKKIINIYISHKISSHLLCQQPCRPCQVLYLLGPQSLEHPRSQRNYCCHYNHNLYMYIQLAS